MAVGAVDSVVGVVGSGECMVVCIGSSCREVIGGVIDVLLLTSSFLFFSGLLVVWRGNWPNNF